MDDRNEPPRRPSLDALLGSSPCGCGSCRRVGTEEVRIGPAIDDPLLRRAAGRPLALFGDAWTLEACGARLADVLRARDAEVAVHRIGGDEPPHADDRTVDRVRETLAVGPETALPVAVGSGTINDVVKAAAHDLGRPYVAVATAASMNGYTSAIAAITVGGLKSTLPSTPAVAVLADPAVLAASPARMSVSGLADLLSKPVSSADWRLGAVLWGEPWCPVPADLAGAAVERAAAVAEGIRDGDAGARVVLLEALLLSGISMAVAGTSSPASGGEHLISHFLDMCAPFEPGGPRRPALHGEQVGVGTAMSTRTWLAVARDRRHAPAPGPAPDLDDARRRIGSLDCLPDDLRARFLEQSRAKLDRIAPAATRRSIVASRLADVLAAVAPDLALAERTAGILPSIGAPCAPSDIGTTTETVRVAWREGRWIRDRYTVLDLVDDLGWAERIAPEALRFDADGTEPFRET